MLKTSLACSHGRILCPILLHVPEDVFGAVGLVRRVQEALIHLRKIRLREGKEGDESVEIDPLKSLCFHGVKPVLMRGELLMETVDSVVQSKEDRKLCLRCLGVDLQGSCGQSFLCPWQPWQPELPLPSWQPWQPSSFARVCRPDRGGPRRQ